MERVTVHCGPGGQGTTHARACWPGHRRVQCRHPHAVGIAAALQLCVITTLPGAALHHRLHHHLGGHVGSLHGAPWSGTGRWLLLLLVAVQRPGSVALLHGLGLGTSWSHPVPCRCLQYHGPDHIVGIHLADAMAWSPRPLLGVVMGHLAGQVINPRSCRSIRRRGRSSPACRPLPRRHCTRSQGRRPSGSASSIRRTTPTVLGFS